MGAVKGMLMDDAENILNVTADKLIGGDISEDDALDILDKNLETLGILGFDNKYDALAVVYQLTDGYVGGKIWKVVQVNLDKSFKFEILNTKNILKRNNQKKKYLGLFSLIMVERKKEDFILEMVVIILLLTII